MAWVNFTSFVFNSATTPTDYLVGYIGNYEQRYPVWSLKSGLSAGTFRTNYLDVTNSAYISGDLTVDGNTLIRGNLSALGDTTTIETIVTVTSSLSVTNIGTGPALWVKQIGTQPVAQFYDDSNLLLEIGDNNLVTINGLLSVDDNVTITNNLYLTGNQFTRGESTFTGHLSVDDDVDITGNLYLTGSQFIKQSLDVDENLTVGSHNNNNIHYINGRIIGNNYNVSFNTASAGGEQSFAINRNTWADNSGSFSAGLSSWAKANNSFAGGNTSYTGGANSIAFGVRSNAAGVASVAIGQDSFTGNRANFSYNAFSNSLTFTSGTSSIAATIPVATRLQLYWDTGAVSRITVLTVDPINGTIVPAETSPLTNLNDGSQITSGTGRIIWSVSGTGSYSSSIGLRTEASGVNSHAEGSDTIASGDSSHAEGAMSFARGVDAHAEGHATVALGNYSHSEGSETTASGTHSHAENYGCIAEGITSHAEGYMTIARGVVSHAQGNETYALGQASHAEGSYTVAAGNVSHAAGYNAEAAHNYTFVWADGNLGTAVARISSTRAGQFAVSASGGVYIPGNLGVGTDDNSRKLTVNGGAYITQTLTLSNLVLTGAFVRTFSSPITASGDFMVININGTNRAIRLWDF
jgi:hypothetical protein